MDQEPRNPLTHAQHRRQTLLQIWLPLGLCLAVVLGLVIFVSISAAKGAPQLAQWTDAMLVVVIAPMCLIGLIGMAIVFGMVLLTGRVLQGLPRVSYMAQLYVELISLRIKSIADGLAHWVIQLAGFSARVKAIANLFKRTQEN